MIGVSTCRIIPAPPDESRATFSKHWILKKAAPRGDSSKVLREGLEPSSSFPHLALKFTYRCLCAVCEIHKMLEDDLECGLLQAK